MFVERRKRGAYWQHGAELSKAVYISRFTSEAVSAC
jgi:hypothetical protein